MDGWHSDDISFHIQQMFMGFAKVYYQRHTSFDSTQDKPEPNVEKVRRARVKAQKPKSTANDSDKRNNVKKRAAKKKNRDGHKTLTAKLKSADAKGTARAVVMASHEKQSSTKRTKTQHKCPSCDHVASRPSHLTKHMLTHTGEKPFSCHICNKRFTQKSNCYSHLKTHSGLKYIFKCSVCVKRFARNDEKTEHEATCNGRRFECHLCKKFSTPKKSQLKEHMRVHTGERPFRCGICCKKFTLKGNLNSHSKIHTNPRPMKFQCSVCARNFTKKTEKDQHESKCQWRRYECYLCKSYATYYKSIIIRHMQALHTGEKPFRCEVCGKRCGQKSDLKRHQKSMHKCRADWITS